jgi:hypothetical protein
MGNRLFFIILLSGVLIQACKKTDTNPPVIQLFYPLDSSRVFCGDSLYVEGKITDDESLSQYKIDIHNDFDGHGHDKSSIQPWLTVVLGDMTGREFYLTGKIGVPSTAAAGWYHVVVTASDASGNQSDFQLRSIRISNPADTINPAVTIQNPTEGQTFTIGTTIPVQANISDNSGVYMVNVKVNRPNSASLLYTSTDTISSSPTSYVLNKTISTSGIAWTQGSYVLTVKVYDTYYNQTESKINLIIN